MTLSNQKEMFSVAFVRAVAAAAGFNVGKMEVDDDSIDIEIAAKGPMGTTRSPKLDVQLKCTAGGLLENDHLTYQIPLKNYDDLRHSDYVVPRILVLVTVPKNPDHWIDQTDHKLVLCHCGYWISLLGRDEIKSEAKDPRVTIQVPRSQQFSVNSLKLLMAKIGGGGKP